MISTTLPPPPRRDEIEGSVLPHDLGAERSALGAALLHESAADHLVDHMVPADFFRRAHAQIFEGIRSLRQRSAPIDLTTLRVELGPKLDEAGGPAYVSALVDGVPRSTNVEHYVSILKDLHAKRSLMAFANRTLDHVASGQHSAHALLIDTDRRLVELQGGHVEGRMFSLRQTGTALLDDLDWRLKHRGELTGVDTGFASVNRETLGWQRGDLIVVAARPSIGKTTFVMNGAVRAAQTLRPDTEQRRRIAVFSLEMRRKQLEYRMLSNLSGVPLSNLLSGNIMDADWGAIANARGLMDDLEIHIDDRAGQSVWEIRSACRRLRAEGGLDLVIIDYVQLMPGSLERKGATRNDEVTDISRRLKALGDELSCPVVLLSQLSRASEKRPDPRPKLTDLRESGALEQDADVVILLHRRHHREGGTTNVIIEKARNGPTGTVNVSLERDTVTFTDGGDDPVPEPEAAAPAKKVVRIGAPDRRRR